MKPKALFKICSFSLILALFSFKPAKKIITVYLIGDSTISNKAAKAYPETGWGMELQPLLKRGVKVDNRALNGRSTLSFRTDKNGATGEIKDNWQPVADQLQEGDYVLIEFGHNDEKTDKPGVGVSLTDYKMNLVRYVNETREKKAIPVLLTSIVRRNFINGVLTDTHGGYPDVVRKVADSLQVPLIDMQQKTARLLSSLGDTASVKLFNHVPAGHVNYPAGKKDDTHLSPQGAKAIAALVAEGMRELKLPLLK